MERARSRGQGSGRPCQGRLEGRVPAGGQVSAGCELVEGRGWRGEGPGLSHELPRAGRPRAGPVCSVPDPSAASPSSPSLPAPGTGKHFSDDLGVAAFHGPK